MYNHTQQLSNELRRELSSLKATGMRELWQACSACSLYRKFVRPDGFVRRIRNRAHKSKMGIGWKSFMNSPVLKQANKWSSKSFDHSTGTMFSHQCKDSEVWRLDIFASHSLGDRARRNRRMDVTGLLERKEFAIQNNARVLCNEVALIC